MILFSLLFFNYSASGAGFGVTINFFAVVDFFVVIAFSPENTKRQPNQICTMKMCLMFLFPNQWQTHAEYYGWNGCLNLKRFTDEAFFNDTLYFEVIAACFLTWQLRAEGKQLHFVTGLICHIALQRLINLWLLIKLRFKCHCWRAGTW